MTRVLLILLVALLAKGILAPLNDVVNPVEVITEGRGSSVQSDATVKTLLPIPVQISTVMDITIQTGGQYCAIVNIESELQQLNSFSLETKSREVQSNWNVEIISSVYDPTGQIMYILMDNGTLVITSFITNGTLLPGITKAYSYQEIGSTDTWLVGRYELVFAFSRLYIIHNDVLRFALLHEEGYWKISGNLAATEVISASYQGNYLYILTYKELFRLNKEGNLEEIGLKGQKFIDVHINGDDYFLLDEKVGLVMGQFSNPSSIMIFKIERVEFSKKVRAHKNILFIIYQFQNRNFLGEYFLSNSQIVLNRYYHKYIISYPSYYSIKDIHLSDNYAILDAYNEYILLRHSINRRSFPNLSPAEYLYKSQGVKVVKIDLLQPSNNFTFIATFKEKIEHFIFKKTIIEIDQNYVHAINTLFVECQSNEPRNFVASITYKGICSSPSKSAQNTHCTAKIADSLSVQYSHVKKMEQHKSNRFIFLIVFVALLLFSALLLLATQKRISKIYKKLKIKQETMKNQKEQHSMNMEQTFNADIEKKT